MQTVVREKLVKLEMSKKFNIEFNRYHRMVYVRWKEHMFGFIFWRGFFHHKTPYYFEE